mgnify:CR=1 FL=1
MEHRCKEEKQLDPTPATVRAETWLAIAGGAAAIGYFPNRWSAPIGDEIARTNREIKALSQALLAPAANATSDVAGGHGCRRDPERRDLRHRRQHDRVDPPGEVHRRRDRQAARPSWWSAAARSLEPTTQGFADNFGPLAARVYIIPPAGW